MLHRGGGAKYIMKLIGREALRAPRSTGPWARAVFAAAYKAGSESVIATKTQHALSFQHSDIVSVAWTSVVQCECRRNKPVSRVVEFFY